MMIFFSWRNKNWEWRKSIKFSCENVEYLTDKNVCMFGGKKNVNCLCFFFWKNKNRIERKIIIWIFIDRVRERERVKKNGGKDM